MSLSALVRQRAMRLSIPTPACISHTYRRLPWLILAHDPVLPRRVVIMERSVDDSWTRQGTLSRTRATMQVSLTRERRLLKRNHEDTDHDILQPAFQRRADQDVWWTHQGWSRTQCDDGRRAASGMGHPRRRRRGRRQRRDNQWVLPVMGRGIWHGDAGRFAGEPLRRTHFEATTILSRTSSFLLSQANCGRSVQSLLEGSVAGR